MQIQLRKIYKEELIPDDLDQTKFSSENHNFHPNLLIIDFNRLFLSCLFFFQKYFIGLFFHIILQKFKRRFPCLNYFGINVSLERNTKACFNNF